MKKKKPVYVQVCYPTPTPFKVWIMSIKMF